MKRYLPFLPFVLSGCVGSYVVHGDPEMNPFESLHTVPDRPAKRPAAFYKEQETLLRNQHASLTKAHEEERRGQGLEVTRPCSKKEELSS